MAGFRYPFDVQTTLEPLRHELGPSFDQVVATMADRDRSLEDLLRIIDPVARIVAWAGGASTVIPPGWLLCDGSAVSRVGYAALFAALGTTYGAGDGTNTFTLPSFKGRVQIGQDTTQVEFAAIAQVGGSKTISNAAMPAHNHGGFVGDNAGFTPAVQNMNPVAGGTGFYLRGATPILTIPTDGGSTAGGNMPPYQVVRYLIRY